MTTLFKRIADKKVESNNIIQRDIKGKNKEKNKKNKNIKIIENNNFNYNLLDDNINCEQKIFSKFNNDNNNNNKK